MRTRWLMTRGTRSYRCSTGQGIHPGKLLPSEVRSDLFAFDRLYHRPGMSLHIRGCRAWKYQRAPAISRIDAVRVASHWLRPSFYSINAVLEFCVALSESHQWEESPHVIGFSSQVFNCPSRFL